MISVNGKGGGGYRSIEVRLSCVIQTENELLRESIGSNGTDILEWRAMPIVRKRLLKFA